MAARTARQHPALAALILTSIIAFSGCSAPPPQNAVFPGERDPAQDYDNLASDLESWREKYNLPAMAAAIVRTDGVAAIAVTGERRAGSGVEVTAADQWHIGSNTKSMTATLIGMLVEEGSLSWETTLAEVFPALTGAMRPAMRSAMHPDWRAVTVEQLLAHRGGAPGSLIDGFPQLWQRLVSREDDPRQQRRLLLEQVAARAPEVAPGTRYVYSNAGYVIAGAIAEEVTGVPWEQLMRSRLFEPLGMASAGFGAPGDTTSLDQPRGHTEAGIPVEPGPRADNPPGLGPAGTVHLTIDDWAKYARFHLLGAAGRANDLLSVPTFSKLHTPYSGDDGASYAMGWEVTDEAGPNVRVLAHAGSNTLWYAMIWMPLEHEFAILIVTNQGGDRAREAVDEAVWELARDEYGRRRR